jgi:hypothetical protein
MQCVPPGPALRTWHGLHRPAARPGCLLLTSCPREVCQACPSRRWQIHRSPVQPGRTTIHVQREDGQTHVTPSVRVVYVHHGRRGTLAAQLHAHAPTSMRAGTHRNGILPAKITQPGQYALLASRHACTSTDTVGEICLGAADPHLRRRARQAACTPRRQQGRKQTNRQTGQVAGEHISKLCGTVPMRTTIMHTCQNAMSSPALMMYTSVEKLPVPSVKMRMVSLPGAELLPGTCRTARACGRGSGMWGRAGRQAGRQARTHHPASILPCCYQHLCPYIYAYTHMRSSSCSPGSVAQGQQETCTAVPQSPRHRHPRQSVPCVRRCGWA